MVFGTVALSTTSVATCSIVCNSAGSCLAFGSPSCSHAGDCTVRRYLTEGWMDGTKNIFAHN